MQLDDIIPNGFIVFISGVPGVGKTTLSYELLQKCHSFRIIEETDIIREILQGYSNHLKSEFGDNVSFIFEKVKICEHGKLLTFDEAKEQCNIMKNSLEQIVNRQQRKGIASIINGVHIIPEILNGLAGNKDIIYINLYVTDENILYERLLKRNSLHMLKNTSLIFQTNKELYLSTKKLSKLAQNVYNINVGNSSINESIERISSNILKSIKQDH